MEYAKPALTFEQQATQLIARGLDCERDELIARLRSVSYFRLSGYWIPFCGDDDSFIEGTTLTAVWRRYTFDRHLRLLVLDAIERVEVCIRTELVYQLAHRQGPFGYREAANLPGLRPDEHAELIEQLVSEYSRSRERFIEHFKKTYGDVHASPPYWMITELMTFGALQRLFRGSPKPVRRIIAERFDVSSLVLESWLGALNAVRNICAHHARLWNRELGYKPMIPQKSSGWHMPVEVLGNRMFGVLTILKYLLDEVAPQSLWPVRLSKLHDRYPEVPRREMGYPDHWRDCPIWLR
jgi:abortive infection bacteriophage resistance protein